MVIGQAIEAVKTEEMIKKLLPALLNWIFHETSKAKKNTIINVSGSKQYLIMYWNKERKNELDDDNNK